MPHTEELAELAALSALGALDDSDRRSFERHLLEGCARCEDSVRTWEREISLLGISVPGVEPPAALRGRTLGFPRSGRIPAGAAASAGGVRWLAIAAGILAAVVSMDDFAQRRSVRESAREAAKLSAELQRSREEVARKDLRVRFIEDPDIQAVLLSGLAPRADARGKILFSPRARRAIILAANLPALAPDRQYELWFIAGGKPIAAGVFDARAGEATVFESTPLPEGAIVEKFAVTIEPRGGGPQPTGPMVLIGGSSVGAG